LFLDEANSAKLMAADLERIMALPDTIDAEFGKLPPACRSLARRARVRRQRRPMSYASNIFPKRLHAGARNEGHRLALPHLAAIGAPVARPSQAFFWVSLLAAMPRVTIARAGELVMLPADCAYVLPSPNLSLKLRLQPSGNASAYLLKRKGIVSPG